MNKVYKVIWSHVKHCYVVVSEVAKSYQGGGKIQYETDLAPLFICGRCAVAAGGDGR